MFSPAVIERATAPRHSGAPREFTHRGDAGVEGDGPFVTIWLTVSEGAVLAASFNSHGCPAAVASADTIAEVCIGRSLVLLATVEPADVMRILGGLPEGKEECAVLAVAALRAAIKNGLTTSESEDYLDG